MCQSKERVRGNKATWLLSFGRTQAVTTFDTTTFLMLSVLASQYAIYVMPGSWLRSSNLFSISSMKELLVMNIDGVWVGNVSGNGPALLGFQKVVVQGELSLVIQKNLVVTSIFSSECFGIEPLPLGMYHGA